MRRLADLLADLPGPDVASRDAVVARAAAVLRPTGALARLDEVAAWLAAWQRTERPAVERPHAMARGGEGNGRVNGRRRLAGSALFVGEDDEMRLAHGLIFPPALSKRPLPVRKIN